MVLVPNRNIKLLLDSLLSSYCTYMLLLENLYSGMLVIKQGSFFGIRVAAVDAASSPPGKRTHRSFREYSTSLDLSKE